jgi:hypothetical protein
MGEIMNIRAALHTLRPGAYWTLETDNYKDLVWADDNQTKPSEKEVVEKLAELENEFLLAEVSRLRALEYPSFKDYLDGIVKNDAAQVEKYIQDCLAVKAKYPK